ncbi:ion channel, partial [Vibrio metschnikovii]|uniref:ion channel n=1 Tax=Vibrio metschnikovii TaxID=28172 RepID=UPI002FC78CE1
NFTNMVMRWVIYEGILQYFVGTSISTLGYGDVVLTKPWRQIGPIIAIAGVLKFGCSTAFLFFVIQTVWENSF